MFNNSNRRPHQHFQELDLDLSPEKDTSGGIDTYSRVQQKTVPPTGLSGRQFAYPPLYIWNLSEQDLEIFFLILQP